MSIFQPADARETSRMLSVFRIVAAGVFITSGTMKLFNFPPLPAGAPAITFLSEPWIAGVLEVVGGPLILLGLFTRPVAFVLAGEMAVAYWQYAFPVSPWPTSNFGVPAILYCFFFLYLVFSGPGEWSIDAAINSRRADAAARQITP
ncbi:MAG: DoxX family protein [Gemmatimonadota bacterium]|nr:DoxX family protein [Gemmatimonadota bacterium]